MVRLILLRHAKSDWGDGDLADHDRPLAPRGESAAPLMGAVMRARGLRPDRVLCSTATRARETLRLVGETMDEVPGTEFTRDIYEADPQDLLELARAANGDATVLMMVGHNPTFQDTAMSLAGTGEPQDLARMAAKFPTGALAVIDFDGQWRDIGWGKGRLDCFLCPRDLV
jgi:phosphohistidine phosphatase